MKTFSYVVWFIRDPFRTEPWDYKGRVEADNRADAYRAAEEQWGAELGPTVRAQVMNWYVKEAQ